MPGWEKPGRKATRTPTVCDIAWAAGVFEGEGCCSPGTGNFAMVVQKEPWLTDRLQQLFGGKVDCKKSYGTRGRAGGFHGQCYRWECYGARARGFLMTIYGFLSPHRQQQVRNMLNRVR